MNIGLIDVDGAQFPEPCFDATQGVTIAADPDVLPMGTEIELDGHTYTVQDTGGAITGNRLDLYFDSHEDALRWGVQEKIVRWSA